VSAGDPLGGVPEATSCACKFRLVTDTPSVDPFAIAFLFRSSICSGVPPASCAAGVAHPLTVDRSCPVLALRNQPLRSDPFEPSTDRVVGHGDKEESLADVRRTDARNAQIRRPDGVARCFQVSLNSVEPRESSRRGNLLAKND